MESGVEDGMAMDESTGGEATGGAAGAIDVEAIDCRLMAEMDRNVGSERVCVRPKSGNAIDSMTKDVPLSGPPSPDAATFADQVVTTASVCMFRAACRRPPLGQRAPGDRPALPPCAQLLGRGPRCVANANTSANGQARACRDPRRASCVVVGGRRPLQVLRCAKTTGPPV